MAPAAAGDRGSRTIYQDSGAAELRGRRSTRLPLRPLQRGPRRRGRAALRLRGAGSRTSLRGGVRCTAGVLVRVRVRCVYATCACAVCGDACNVCVCGEYTRRVYMRYIVCMQNVYVAHMVYGDICVYTQYMWQCAIFFIGLSA